MVRRLIPLSLKLNSALQATIKIVNAILHGTPKAFVEHPIAQERFSVDWHKILKFIIDDDE